MVEFDHFRKEAGLHTFTLSAKEWIDKTNAIGMYVQAGRYGGTYAHKDIAFEFGSAISPIFKLYLLKEYQRLARMMRTIGLNWSGVLNVFFPEYISIKSNFTILQKHARCSVF